jgi:hypothetical protein
VPTWAIFPSKVGSFGPVSVRIRGVIYFQFYFGRQYTSTKDFCESSKSYPYPRWLAGPEIADFWGLNGPLLPQSPLEKVGGRSPPPFQVGFAVGGGRLDPQNRRFPARPAPGRRISFGALIFRSVGQAATSRGQAVTSPRACRPAGRRVSGRVGRPGASVGFHKWRRPE